MMEVVSGDKWGHKPCKAPVKSPTYQHPVFYWPDALPALKGNDKTLTLAVYVTSNILL